MRSFSYFLIGALLVAVALKPLSADPDTGETLLGQAGQSVVKLTAPSNPNHGGTGFFLRAPSGRILTITNSHICELAEEGRLSAYSPDGTKSTLMIMEISDYTDLCILDGPDLGPKTPALTMAKYQHRTERLWVVGHPLLQENTAESGYVVSFERIMLSESEREEANCKGASRRWVEGSCVRIINAYTTNIVIFPGNSGSPVLTKEGEVVGVMFAADRRTNWGCFVPFSDLADMLKGR